MASYTPAQLAASYSSQQSLANLLYNDGSTTGFAYRAPVGGSAVIATIFGYLKAEGFFTGKFPLKYYSPAQATVLGTAGIEAVMRAEGITTGSLVAGTITHAPGDTDVVILASLRSDGYTSGSGQVINPQIDPLVAPAIVGALLYHNTNQSVASNTILAFNSETFDLDANHNSGLPTRLVCNTAGYYVINMWGTFLVAGNNGASNRVTVWFRVNGGVTVGQKNREATVWGTSDSIDLTALYHLNVGDYVEVLATLTGATCTISTSSFNFGMMLIR